MADKPFEFGSAHIALPADVAKEWLTLPSPQLRIMNFYLMAKPDSHYGAVMAPASKIAAFLGMNRSQFARDVRALASGGWLDRVTRQANITYYAIAPRVLGQEVMTNVVQMRQRSA